MNVKNLKISTRMLGTFGLLVLLLLAVVAAALVQLRSMRASMEVITGNAMPSVEVINLLDLGCGTGLLGLFLGPMQGYLIGVDSSLKMIEEAAKHGVYDRFHNVDLLGALQNTPANEYDVLTLLDVLIYIGAPQLVIPNAARILKTDGELIFSCETAPEDGPDLVLQPSQRYAHKRSHIEALCKQAGFSVSTDRKSTRLNSSHT